MALSPSYSAPQQSMAQPQVSMAQPSVSMAQPSVSMAQPTAQPVAQPTAIPQAAAVSILAPPPPQPIAADGSVIFSEFQAQVFNRVEALYKTNGYLSQPLFEDSYLLSKATATFVIGSVPVVGTQQDVTSLAMATYRGVLGIKAPSEASPKPTTSPVAAVTPTRFTPPTSTVTSIPQVPTSMVNTSPVMPVSTPYSFNYQGLRNMMSGIGSMGSIS